MQKPSPIFQEHYAQYLDRLARLDLARIAPAAGGEINGSREDGSLVLAFFNTRYVLSGRGIHGPGDKPPEYDACTILSRYLIMAGERVGVGGPGPESSGPYRQGEWTSFRDLKDAGPLTVYFSDNVETALARILSGNTDTALARLAGLGAFVPELDARYDLKLAFPGLPNIPMLVLFNDVEDGFPPSCSVLFRPDVENHLDAECIAMMGVRLAVLIRRSLAG